MCNVLLPGSSRKCLVLVRQQNAPWFSSLSEEASSSRAAARRERADTMAAKRAQLEALLRSNGSESGGGSEVQHNEGSQEAMKAKAEKRELDEEAEHRRSEERIRLLDEAGFIVRSLYRTCLRSVRVIRPGNERDEADFREREEKQKREMEEVFTDDIGSFSFAPPVNRENELRSRAEYYTEQIREGFGQEMDRLEYDPWREDDVDQFVHLVRHGEDQRRYILSDYQFEDPYADVFDRKRLEALKEQAEKLIHDEYEARGWILQSERKKNIESVHDTCEVFGEDIDFRIK